ncbi:MAG TPA: family 16 glycosylhydrolase [archaeon]|nr:family 16 glycosylhydrolase [archaeon]
MNILKIINKILLFLYKIGFRIKVKPILIGERITQFKYCYPWGRTNTGSNHVYISDNNVIKRNNEYSLFVKKEHVVDNGWWNTNNIEFEYTRGVLFSENTFLYGNFEAEIYIPKGYGLWSAFWLFGAMDDNSRFAEIDIFEEYGDKQKFTYNTHAGSDYNHNIYGKADGMILKNIEDRWHYYRLDWNKKYLKYYIDDYLVGIRSAKNIDIPMHVIISSGIENKDLDVIDKILPKEMKVRNIIVNPKF